MFNTHNEIIYFCRHILFNELPLSLEAHLILSIPDLFLFTIFCLILFFVFFFQNQNLKVKKYYINNTSCVINLILYNLIVLVALYLNIPCKQHYLFDFSFSLVEDIVYVKVGLCFIFAIYVYLLHNEVTQPETCIYLLINFISLLYLLSVTTFLSFFLCIELFSFSTYILLVYRQNSVFAIEAGLKYFILGSIMSCWLLFSICIFYSFSGISTFFDLMLWLSNYTLCTYNITDYANVLN